MKQLNQYLFLFGCLYIAISLMLTGVAYSAEQKVWYDESDEIPLWEQGYSKEHQSPIYSESPHPRASQQVLTGNILVVFLQDKSQREIESFMRHYSLSFVKKIKIGTGRYLFKTESEKENSLKIANLVYKSGWVKAAYPDWFTLKNR